MVLLIDWPPMANLVGDGLEIDSDLSVGWNGLGFFMWVFWIFPNGAGQNEFFSKFSIAKLRLDPLLT